MNMLWQFSAVVTVLAAPSTGILPPRPNPDVWFPMDVQSDGILIGREYNGIMIGGPKLVPGVLGKGLELNMGQESQLVSLGDLRHTCMGDPGLCPNGLSVAAWLQLGPHQQSIDKYIFSSGGQSRQSWGMALFYQEDKLSFVINTKNASWDATVDIPAEYAQSWFHVAAVWTVNSRLDLYIHGGLQKTQQVSASKSISSSQYNEFVLGEANNAILSQTHSGSCVLDELMFWYRNLSMTEVLQNAVEGLVMARASMKTLRSGSPFPKLNADEGIESCYVLNGSDSQRSSLVEVVWATKQLTGGPNVNLTVKGDNRLDYIRVFAAGEEQNSVTTLNECHQSNPLINPLFREKHYECCCGEKPCSKVFIDVSRAEKHCDVTYSFCLPIYVCSVEESG